MRSSSDRSAARKYSRALLESGSPEHHGERAEALNALARLWTSQAALRGTILNPSVKEDQKLAVARDLADKLLPSDPHFSNFLCLLIKNKRMQMLDLLAEQFKKELDALKRRLQIKITSASEVTPGEQQELEAQLKQGFGGLANLTWVTDSTLLGGAVLQSGDRVFDGSITGALKRMETRLRG